MLLRTHSGGKGTHSGLRNKVRYSPPSLLSRSLSIVFGISFPKATKLLENSLNISCTLWLNRGAYTDVRNEETAHW